MPERGDHANQRLFRDRLADHDLAVGGIVGDDAVLLKLVDGFPRGQVADADILRKQPDRGELPFRILPVVDALLQQLDHLAVFQHGDSVILFKNIPNLVYLYYTKVFFICQYPEKIFIGFFQ